MTDADVIVVGAGSSGCALAARLSEDPGRRVLLIESGPVPRSLTEFPADLLDPGFIYGAHRDHPQNWAHAAELSTGRPYAIARGRVLGGSSTINGGYFIRARREDFDHWSAAGNDAWRWENVLPILRAIESDGEYGPSETHGSHGPIPISRAAQDDPITQAFSAAAIALGFPFEPDKNDQQTPGIGPVPMNVLHGTKWNAGIAYVLPALDRANLSVLGGSTVSRVVFNRQEATGVEVATGEGLLELSAGEIVLCAGAIGTARLLLRSGVGDGSQLRSQDIAVVADSPGVGAAFSDHPQIAIRWRAKPGVVDHGLPRIMGAALAATSGRSAHHGDLEVLPLLKPTSTLVGAPAAGDDVLEMLVGIQSPVARGSIRAHPETTIDYHYLTSMRDRASARIAVRLATDLIELPAFRSVSNGLVDLDRSVLADDDTLDSWIAARIATAFHSCGSTPFAAPEGGTPVVDQYGAVLGVDHLRIADLGILPTVPLRGPAATAVLVGELIAAHMRSR